MPQTRRNFIKTATAATAASLLPLADVIPASARTVRAAEGYELLFMATNWGFAGSVDEFCAAAKKEGYDGIEVWWPKDAKSQDQLFTALSKYGLQVGFMCSGAQRDAREHLDVFKANLMVAAGNTRQKPIYVNCHSGKDYFSFSENGLFIEHTDKLSQDTGVPIYHETHRGRMLYAATIAREFILKYPKLRLTLDISHWCAVHESLLADQQETVALALERADHIHSRVGHQEGPQVNDPRAPEWKAAVEAHLSWWDKIIERKKRKGERMTILTEFGPPNYLPTIPYTMQPVANQWNINVYMMNLLRKRYA